MFLNDDIGDKTKISEVSKVGGIYRPECKWMKRKVVLQTTKKFTVG